MLLLLHSSLVRQAIQQVNAQNHHQQPNRHNDEQRKRKPTQHHGAGADAAAHAAISEVLRDLCCCYRGGVLPEDGDEHEDGGDEDEGQGDLRDGPRGEGLDVYVGAGAGVALFVPAREGGEEEEGYEGEDDGYDAGRVVSLWVC
jgi:hypothetical protein